jgi:multiple sugar transport system ATP-binding protein
MSNITLEGISKSFGAIDALQDVSFSIKDGEFFVLLGPTGAGKTTTLRIIAGLEKQDAGSVLFDDERMDNLPPAERDTAFVFQQYSLYPTMTVFDNLAFPLRSPLRKVAEDEIRRRVEEAAEKLLITKLLDRKTSNLSGGEMQRVSIGRAIVRSPRVYLMDEPLSNLDAKLRESLRVELQHLQKTAESTTLFVTHDQIEALTMADRIGVLHEGQLMQVGTPDDIYDRPATTFVARLVGTPRINLLDAGRENGTIGVSGGAISLSAGATALPESFQLGIRPEDIDINTGGEFGGRVVLTEPLGVETIVHIEVGDVRLVSLVPGMVQIHMGDQVRFDLNDERFHFFDHDGQRIN